MKVMHALCAVTLAGAALLGGDAIALAQPAAATTAAPSTPLARGTYMKIDGMPGAATDKLHPAWIEIQSFQWGVGRGTSSPNGSAADRQGRAPSVSEIVITKARDASSPKLMMAMQQGRRLPEVDIEFVRNDKQVYYQVKLKEVTISRFSETSSGDRPTESVSLNFGKIEWTYTQQKSDGTMSAPQTAPAGWDVAKVTSS